MFRFPPFGWLSLCLLLTGTISARGDERVMLPDSKINGTPIHLAFDTGSSFQIILMRNCAERLGLKVTWPPAGSKAAPGGITYGLTDPCTVSVMGKTFPDLRLAVYDTSSNEPDVDAVFGWSVWQQDVVVLKVADKNTGRLAEVPPESRNWTKLRIKTGLKTLELEELGSAATPRLISIDTGNPDGVALPPAEWKMWRDAHADHLTAKFYYMPAVGWQGIEEGWADQISIGGLVLTQVPVREANQAETATTDKSGFAGSLGLTALSRLDLVIDGKNGVAYANPRHEPPRPYPHNHLGALIVPSDPPSNDLVAHVIVGGPAYKAGVRTGDILLKIDSLDVTQWRSQPATESSFNQWLQAGPDFKSVLTLRRDSAVITANVVFENILGPRAADSVGFTSTADEISALNLWLSLHPESEFMLNRRAFLKIQQHDYAGASADEDRVLALNPSNAYALNLRGYAKTQQKNYRGAMVDYDRAIALDPTDAPTLGSRGDLKTITKDYAGAIADYDQAAALNPANVSYLQGRAYVESEQRNFRAAIVDYDRMLAIDPKSRLAVVSRGQVHQRLGEYGAAATDYTRAIALNPQVADYDRFYLSLCLRLQKLDDAAAGLKTTTAWRDAWTEAIARYLGGQSSEAEFQTKIASGPSDQTLTRQCEAFYFIGMIHLLQNDRRGAAEYFRKATATGLETLQKYIFAQAELDRLTAQPEIRP
jgi:tetratricopeptide (TPR) repeat protein